MKRKRVAAYSTVEGEELTIGNLILIRPQKRKGVKQGEKNEREAKFEEIQIEKERKGGT